MGKFPIKNEQLAPKLATKSLEKLKGFLIVVGKPFYVATAAFVLFIYILFHFSQKLLSLIKALYIDSYDILPALKGGVSLRRMAYKRSIHPWAKARGFLECFYKKSKKISHRLSGSLNKNINKTSKRLVNFKNDLLKTIFKSKNVAVLTIHKVAKRKRLPHLEIQKKILLLSVNIQTLSKLIFLKIKLRFVPHRKKKARVKRVKEIPLIKYLSIVLIAVFGLGFISSILFWYFILKDLPSPVKLKEKNIAVSSKVYDRNGVLLYNFYKDQNRTPLKLEEIPTHVRLSTIAIEDAEFYSHPGFSVKGIIRAIYKNLRQGELTGGSTITQQLVKNTLLTPERTLIRKIKEIVLSVEVELAYSKNDILEMYLNTVSYGGTAYGIKEAAHTYFDKDLDELTLSEAALLAGLPKSPTTYSPFGPNPENALKRQKDVLKLMETNGFITDKQRLEAENEKIIFAKNKIPIRAPHFVFFVKETLEKEYGKDVVESGGLEIKTTLDIGIQELAEKVVNEEIERLQKLNVSNAAVLVLNPKSGEILAMVGSKNYFDIEHDGNVNVVTRPRQPGSSIKVVNYSYALSNGFTAATMIEDSPTTFLIEGQPPYSPKNYEGGYRGNLTLRNAFAESRNIPAVKVLATYGVSKMIDMGRLMGITTWTKTSDYGLSLTLGGGDVKLIDLARAYATIANYGKKPDLNAILQIKDKKGKTLEEFGCQKNENNLLAQASSSESAAFNISDIICRGDQVLDERVAFLITDILKDNNARSASFGTSSLLNISGHPEVAVKTGTSNDLRDNLAIGYNQNYLVAVWVGNNDNTPMSRIASGVTGATPIWNKIMSALLNKDQSLNWRIPEKLVQLPICPYTGTLSCEGCPVRLEWFLEENNPDKTCSPEWFKKENSASDTSTNISLPNITPGQGQILPDAAKIEVIDLREQNPKIPIIKFGKKKQNN